MILTVCTLLALLQLKKWGKLHVYKRYSHGETLTNPLESVQKYGYNMVPQLLVSVKKHLQNINS